MRFNTTLPGNWRKTFAFLPVRVATDEVRWLEVVETRKVPYVGPMGNYFWLRQYRAIRAVQGFPEPNLSLAIDPAPLGARNTPKQSRPQYLINPYIYNFQRGRSLHIADLLEALARDHITGEPYDEMKFASEYILFLEERLQHLEETSHDQVQRADRST